MFSRNGQYLINEFEEDTFDKQLPFQSIKIPFKKQRQKILNRLQQKYEIELLKEQIHQKCKVQELTYLDQLEKQRQKFISMRRQQQKIKKQNLMNFIHKKYQLQKNEQLTQRVRSKTQKFRDSIDQVKEIKHKKRLNFSLEPSQQKEKIQVAQNEWVKRVMMGRKKLQKKFGRYYQLGPVKIESDSDSSSNV